MLNTHTFSFRLPVWRILYDALPSSATDSLLVLELRNKTTVEWCVVNVTTSRVLWQHSFPETNWWTSLIGFYAGKILLHSYSGTEQPAPKCLYAIDTLSGQMSWKAEGCKFEETNGVVIKTSKATPDQTFFLETRALETGEISPYSIATYTSHSPIWQFPTSYQETNPYYSVIAQFIHKLTGQIPQKAINYGEIAGHILFFQYLYPANANALSRSILVVNSTKTVLLHEVIDSVSNGTVIEDCFFSEHHTIYLKNLEELVVIKLP